MALTQVSSGGVKDDSIVNADIKSDAAIALSKLASTPAVLTGSTNNTITTVTGANAIQGEANLTFDGNNLKVTAGSEGYSASIQLIADEGDDAPDNWRLLSNASDNALTVSSSESTERVRIDSSGNVKIGEATTDYTYKLTVSGNGSTDNGLFMYDGDAGTWFGIKTEAANGLVTLTADARTGSYPPLTFKVGNSEKLRIQSGGGISFNGDTAADNALDDYEEGTWTPDFFYHSSVSNVYGHYTKIGRMVYAFFNGTIYSSSSSHQRINNLPFTTANLDGEPGTVARGWQNVDIQDGPIYYVEKNSTKVHFYKDNGVAMPASDLNGKTVRGCVIYIAA